MQAGRFRTGPGRPGKGAARGRPAMFRIVPGPIKKPPAMAAFVLPPGSSCARVEQFPEGRIGHCLRASKELDEGSAFAFGGMEGHGKEPRADLPRETILGKLDGK